jgi:hypothetical protein
MLTRGAICGGIRTRFMYANARVSPDRFPRVQQFRDPSCRQCSETVHRRTPPAVAPAGADCSDDTAADSFHQLYECTSGKIDNARQPSREDNMSESIKAEISRAENDREPIASIPEPIDDVPPIDDAPVPPLTSLDETQGG